MDFLRWFIRIVFMLIVIYLFSLVGAISFPFSFNGITTAPQQFLLSILSVIGIAIVAFLLGRGIKSVKGSLEGIGLAYLSALIVGGMFALLELLNFPTAIRFNLTWLGTNWYDSWIAVFIFGASIMLAYFV